MGNLDSTGYNPEECSEVKDFTPVPVGEYVALVFDSEVIDHESGAQTLMLAFQILQGEHQNRKIYVRQNFRKKDRTRNPVGHDFLDSVRKAVGLAKLSDTGELHSVPVTIDVAIGSDTYNGADRVFNTVRKATPLQRQAAPVQQPPQTQQQPYQQPTASAGAWANQNG